MTTERAAISPQDCPEPFWHETHRYCPVCSWQEPQEAPTPSMLEQAVALLERWQDGWSDGSEFPLLDETRAFIRRAAIEESPERRSET